MRQEDIKVPVIAKLEKPRRSRTSRGSSRRSTGSWWPAATSAWSCRSSRCRWCRSARSRRRGAEQAGHRGHRDARVDDHELAADARRGLRRRQRRAGRRRRRDALGGDLGGCAPDRRRAHDGADHRRVESDAPRCRTWCAARGPARGRSSRAKDVGEALEVKALATFTQTGETAQRLSALHRVSRCWRSPSTRGCAASWRFLGVETFLVPGSSTPTTWWPRSTSRCCRSAGSRWVTGSGRAGSRPTPSAPRTSSACTKWGPTREPGGGKAGRRPAGGPRARGARDRRLRRPDAEHERQRIFGGQVAGQALMAAGLRRAGRGVHSLTHTSCGPVTRGGDPLRRGPDPRPPVVHYPPGRRLAGPQGRGGRDLRAHGGLHAGRSRSPSTPADARRAGSHPARDGEIAARHGERAAWMEAMGQASSSASSSDPFTAPPKHTGHQVLDLVPGGRASWGGRPRCTPPP